MSFRAPERAYRTGDSVYTFRDCLSDPFDFTTVMQEVLGGALDPRTDGAAHPEWAKQAERIAALEARIDDPETLKLVTELDNGYGDMANAMFEAGLRFGILSEQYRRGLLDGSPPLDIITEPKE